MGNIGSAHSFTLTFCWTSDTLSIIAFHSSNCRSPRVFLSRAERLFPYVTKIFPCMTCDTISVQCKVQSRRIKEDLA